VAKPSLGNPASTNSGHVFGSLRTLNQVKYLGLLGRNAIGGRECLNEGLNLIPSQHDLGAVSLRTALSLLVYAGGFVVRLKQVAGVFSGGRQDDYAPMGGEVKPIEP